MNSQKKEKAYLKRKRRTNITLKSRLPEYRCVVVRSLKHIRAQLIDSKGNIVITATDLAMTSKTKTEKASEVGKILAKIALEKNINSCTFDRNGFLYHGRVKALCDGMREWGMTV